MQRHRRIATMHIRAFQLMGIISALGVRLAVPYEAIACRSDGIAYGRRKDRQMQRYRRIAAVCIRPLQQMGIIAALSVRIAVPYETIACRSNGIAFRRRVDRQMQGYRRIATHLRLRSIRIIPTLGISRTMPFE